MAMGSACVRYFHLCIMYRMQHYGLVEAMVRCPPATAICFYFCFVSHRQLISMLWPITVLFGK
jgi:hypothetical protein